MIIKRYIHKALLEKLLWILGLLVLVFASNKFIGFLADAVEGHLPADMVFFMLGFKTIAILPKILPISVLIATLLAFSRMAADKELVILASAGISTVFQIKVVLRFILPVCLLVSIITLYLAPWAEQNMYELKKIAKQESDIVGIEVGKFKELNQGERIVYAERASETQPAIMEDVFLQVRQQTKLGVVASANMEFETDPETANKYAVLKAGHRYVGEPGSLNYQITEYEKYAILVEAGESNTVHRKISSWPTADIMFSDKKAHQAEFQWRLSLILSCILLSVLATVLIQSHSSGQRYRPFIIGISIYILYNGLLSIAKTSVRQGEVSAWIGLWWVHLLFMAVLLLLFFQRNIRQRLLRHAQ